MKVARQKGNDWKSIVADWRGPAGKQPRAIAVISSADEDDRRRVMLRRGERTLVFEVPAAEVDDVVREVSNSIAMMFDLVALGVGPLPKPTPPPGPIGDDTIWAATLNVIAAAQVFAELATLQRQSR